MLDRSKWSFARSKFDSKQSPKLGIATPISIKRIEPLCLSDSARMDLAGVQTITKLWLVPGLRSSAEILVLDPQRTQRITGSAFRIPLQPAWRSRQTKQRPFLSGQSWRVLKSGYTAGSPQQGFRRCFADGVNQSLISSARRLGWIIL